MTEIGKVSVRVIPDTRGFASKAKRDLKRLKDLSFKVDVELNERQFNAQVKRLIAKTNSDLHSPENHIKFRASLEWSKRGIASQLRDFKSDVEALEKLQRPTVHANFEVDRRSLNKISEDIKLNVSINAKALQRSIERATEDVSVFGDKKAVEKQAKSMADLASQAFRDRFAKRKLKLEVEADSKKLEEAQVAMERALGIMVGHKSRLAELEDSLESVNEGVAKQSALIDSLNDEWLELSESGEANAHQFSHYANSIRDAEDSLKAMVKEQGKLRWNRDNHANNILAPSIDGADRLKREFDELERQLDGKKVEISAAAERTSFAAVAAELNVMARDRMVVFWTRIQKAGLQDLERHWGNISRYSREAGTNIVKYIGQLAGVRVLWRTFTDMVDWLPRLDMMVPQLAQNFALLTGAVAGAVGGLGLMFTLLSDIGEVGKLVLGLPALLFGAGVSAAILIGAIDDFDAYVPEIMETFNALAAVSDERFWSKATKGVRNLHDSLKPLLDENIPLWAEAWGTSFGALADGFAKPSSLKALERFLKNSIKGTKNAAKGWESLGSAISTMVGAGSETFPDLGTWFSETMADFDRWTSSNAGNIERWIREGMTALSELGSIGVSTVKIIAGVADAFGAAGWPGLTEFEAAMRSLGDAALNLKNSEGFMQTLEQIRYFFEQFDGLGLHFEESWNKLWGMIGDSAETLARPMANALAYILDGFNSAKFQNGFGTFITGIASFIDDIGPGLGAMTSEIGSLLGVVGTAAKSWGPAFNDMLLLFSSAGDKLHPGLIDFVENMGPRLEELVQNITPHVEDFATALGDLLGNENFQDLVGDLIGDLGTLGGIILDVGTWVLQTAGRFSDWYGTLSEGEQKFVRWGGILAGVFSGITAGIAALAFKIAPGKTLGFIAKTFGKVFLKGGLLKIVGPILRAFIGTLFSPIGWVIMISDFIRPLDVATLADAIVDSLGLENTFLGRLTESMKIGISEMFGDQSLLGIFILNFKSIFSNFASGDWVGGITSTIKSLITPMNFIGIIGDAILEALGLSPEQLDGLKAEASRIWEEEGIAGVFSTIWDGIGNALNLGWDMITESIFGWSIPTPFDFIDWLKEKIPEWLGLGGGNSGDEVASAMRADMDFSKGMDIKIPAWLGEAWDKLVGFVKEWHPISLIFKFGTWLAEKIPEWLGISDGFAVGPAFSLGDWAGGIWNGSIRPWLEGGWNSLVSWFSSWAPAPAVIDFVEDPFGTVMKWLGFEGEAGTLLMDGGLTHQGWGNWGDEMFTNQVEPWLQSGWDSLQASVNSWEPANASGGGKGRLDPAGMIGRILGVGPESETYVETGLGRIYRQVTGFNGGVAENFFSTSGTITGTTIEMQTGVETAYSGMTRGAVSEVERLASESRKRHDDAKREAILKSQEMSVGVGSKYGEMRSSASSKLAGLDGDASQKFGSMSSTGKKKTGDMKTGVVSNFSTMQSQAAAKAAVMQANVVRAMTQANVMGVRQANVMSTAYVAAMTRLVSGAMRIASQLRGTLPRLLTINAAGPGRSTGNSFVSGLGSGLSRAVGIARSMAGGIRRALSFSVFSSGAAVGGSFANGLRSRIGSVGAAASALAAAARSRMPNSPADEGPFSGSGWGGWGESIAEELAKGLRKSAPEVAREAERLMTGVNGALESRSTARVGIDFERTRRRYGLAADAEGYQANGTTVNVNVESRSEDPLRDGNRFGGDIGFALRGAGLA